MRISPLQQMYDLLGSVAFGDEPIDFHWSRQGKELDVAFALFNAGLVDGTVTDSLQGRGLDGVRLSVKGAEALAEWSRLLSEAKLSNRLVKRVGQLIWVAAGAGITLAVQCFGAALG